MAIRAVATYDDSLSSTKTSGATRSFVEYSTLTYPGRHPEETRGAMGGRNLEYALRDQLWASSPFCFRPHPWSNRSDVYSCAHHEDDDQQHRLKLNNSDWISLTMFFARRNQDDGGRTITSYVYMTVTNYQPAFVAAHATNITST